MPDRKTEKKNIHSGHRQRMKERYINEGLDNFSPHEALELLLYYSVPQKDTNPIAHELIDRFGSFSAVLDAPKAYLDEVPGVGENTSVLIMLIKELYGYYLRDKRAKIKVFTNISEVGAFLRPHMVTESKEVVYEMCLNAKNELLGCKKLYSGGVNSTEFPMRDAVAYALALNASGVVIAHNHPNGLAMPSRRDLITTRTLKSLLESVGVFLLDHLIFDNTDFISLVSSNVLDKLPSGASLNQIDVRDFGDGLVYDDPLF